MLIHYLFRTKKPSELVEVGLGIDDASEIDELPGAEFSKVHFSFLEQQCSVNLGLIR